MGDVKDRQQLRSVGAGHAVTRVPARRPSTTVTQSPVLRLQALAGNRAVAQLLGAGPSVQRCGGDTDCGCVHDDQDDAGQGGSGPPVQRQAATDAPPPGVGQHDLSSPRFAGDAILEACFDDKARLGVGASGPAVSKVQQALIDLGGNLGPSGADGAYGQATAAAVRKFKADQKLGFETFGDVGPGTMGRLDQLFGPGPSPGPSPGPLPADPFVRDTRPGRMIEGDASACPSPQDIDIVLSGQPSLTNALVGAGPGAVAAPTAPGASACQPAGTHVSIASAVVCFTSKVDVVSSVSFRNVSSGGQFFPYYELRGTIEDELVRLEAGARTRSDTDVTNFVAAARNAKVLIHDHQPIKAELDRMQAIVNRTKSPEKAAMAKLLGPADLVLVVEKTIWSGIESTDRVPSLTRFGSLNTLHDLFESVCHECGAHANRVAKRLKRKGGIVATTPGVARLALSLVAGPAKRDRRPVPFPSGTRHLGDVVPQQGVASAVAAMKKALDAGQIIHARVLSGVGYGNDPNVPAEPKAKPFTLKRPPPEEHSLLIIGFDGDEFVFNDPDGSASSKHGQGFGALHFDSATQRLSTAAVQGAFAVSPTGDQPSGEHRYQVLTLTTV